MTASYAKSDGMALSHAIATQTRTVVTIASLRAILSYAKSDGMANSHAIAYHAN